MIAWWHNAGRFLAFRATLQDFPDSRRLAGATLAVLGAVCLAWALLLMGAMDEPLDDFPVAVMLISSFVFPVLGVVAVLGCALSAFGRLEQFNRASVASALVQSVAMVGVLFPPSLPTTIRPDCCADGFVPWVFHAMIWGVPIATLLWYAVAMPRVWAKALGRGYGVGVLVTVLQNASMVVFFLVGIRTMMSIAYRAG